MMSFLFLSLIAFHSGSLHAVNQMEGTSIKGEKESLPIVASGDEESNSPEWTLNRVLIIAKDDIYLSYFTAVLDSLGVAYDVNSSGDDTTLIFQYPVIIWMTGGNSNYTITSPEQWVLSRYLNRGGNLFITGQDIGFDLVECGLGVDFYLDYLHALYLSDDANFYDITGMPGDPIGDGLSFSIKGGDGANNQWYPSVIDTLNGSVPVFKYDDPQRMFGGIRYEGTYRLVYFSFGFEAIDTLPMRIEVMRRVLRYLVPVPLVKDANVTPVSLSPGDSVFITVRAFSPESLIDVFAEIRVPSGGVVDTAFLYDDGLHGDGGAGDGVYGGSWRTPSTSGVYYVNIYAVDADSEVGVIENAGRVSTVSPPVISFNPDTVVGYVAPFWSGVETLWVRNTGVDTLFFSLEEMDTAVSPSAAWVETLFFDDMEGGEDGWVTVDYSGIGNYWMRVDTHPAVSPWYHSPVFSWYCGDTSTGEYPQNLDNALITPPIYIPEYATSAYLSFWEWYSLYYGYDFGYVEISRDGVNWYQLRSGVTAESYGWKEAVLDLSPYIGDTVYIRFRLASGGWGGGTGWFIDDVVVGIKRWGVTWMDEDTREGRVPPGDSVPVELTFSARDFPSETLCTAILRFTSNAPDTSPVDVPVYLYVRIPRISLSADSFRISIPVNTLYQETLWVKNTGEGELMFTVDEGPYVFSRLLPDTVFYDDVESGADGWEYYGLWHRTSHRFISDSSSWYYGIEDVWNYNTGDANRGALVTPRIDLSTYEDAVLSFWHFLDAEGAPYEHGVLMASRDGGGSWEVIWEKNSTGGQWLQEIVDLDDWVGTGDFRLKFLFDTQDSNNNDFEGWYIDDILITGSPFEADWLSASPSSGKAMEGESVAVIVTVDGSYMVPDTVYRAALVVKSNDINEPVRFAYVTVSTVSQGIGSRVPGRFFISLLDPVMSSDVFRFEYGVPKERRVILNVYDVAGRRVVSLVDGRRKPGYYRVSWNLENVPSGIYFVRFDVPEEHKVKVIKVAVVK